MLAAEYGTWRSNLEAASAGSNQRSLVRAVGFWGLVAMCINAVVGSGVFLLPSESFRLIGPFSLWAPLLFAIPVFILVLNFAEAGSHFTQPGGAYLYTKTAFGDFIGFETGFMNTLARITSLAALSNGFVVSLARLWPPAADPVMRAVLITCALLLFATIHALGIRYGAGVIYFFTAGKVIPLVIFITVALVMFRTNPIPASLVIPGAEADWIDAALLLLFAYAGFENLGIPAGEYRNPKRNLPMALLTGILAIAVIYALAQLAAMSALPDLSATDTPIADAAAVLLGTFGATLVTVGAVLSILGTNLGTMLEASRMLFAIGKGRRFLGGLAYVHPTTRTPIVAIFLLAAIAIPVAIAGSFAKLAVLSAVARLTTYLFTCAAVPRLRKISPGFVSPGGLLVPVLGVAVSLALFFILKPQHLIAAAIALTVGALLWLVAGRGTVAVEEEESV